MPTYPWYMQGDPSLSTGQTPVVGTASQIAVTTSTAPVISLSTGLVLPGTLNVAAAVVFTSAITFSGLSTAIPGIAGRLYVTTGNVLMVSTS